ncbi:MAG: cobalt transporter CbiM [Desulfobacterales bacterium]
MHISEGVLSGPVLVSGYALAAAGTALGLKKLDYEKIAQVGILGASFFVASLIHIPIGPANAHLILNGIVGLLLGWGAFPAILVALTLQAVLFQFGGITPLGVNTVIMAVPAVTGFYLFGWMVRRKPDLTAVAAFFCGFGAVFFSAIIAGAALMFTEDDFLKIAYLLVAAHLPVMVVEGIVTAFCVGFLKKVRPEILAAHHQG